MQPTRPMRSRDPRDLVGSLFYIHKRKLPSNSKKFKDPHTPTNVRLGNLTQTFTKQDKKSLVLYNGSELDDNVQQYMNKISDKVEIGTSDDNEFMNDIPNPNDLTTLENT